MPSSQSDQQCPHGASDYAKPSQVTNGSSLAKVTVDLSLACDH